MLTEEIKDICHACPDPTRALNNLDTFLSTYAHLSQIIKAKLPEVALLFSNSQFIANHCILHPEDLLYALENLYTPLSSELLEEELAEALDACASTKEAMRIVRLFKKKHLTLITLADFLKLNDPLNDLSVLADVILKYSLEFVKNLMIARHGVPEIDSFAVIALGKLGAFELNYSSDVDIIFVYRQDCPVLDLHTGQVKSLSAFEFYCKLAEEYCKFLSNITEDGYVYRVDLRLRPQGQKGSIVLSLKGYEDYYESWGQLWERSALIRARAVAGDKRLAADFYELTRPFVYKKYLDMDAIDEIRRLKSQVERIKPGTISRDIKRGYGGIREIEFFIQIFQLIYGGREPLLRERGTIKALHRLLQKGIIGHEDFIKLSNNYIYFRTLEHRLQQLNDMHTHTLPSSDDELDILARKMGFKDRHSFLSDLQGRRASVREIYDSLLEDKATVSEDSAASLFSNVYWDIDSPNIKALQERLQDTKIKNTDRAIYHLMKIRINAHSFQTIKGRKHLINILEQFAQNALTCTNPDDAILHLVDFSAMLSAKESYLNFFINRPDLIERVNFIFAHSKYISRIILINPEYVCTLVLTDKQCHRLTSLKNELDILLQSNPLPLAVRMFKKNQEISLASAFLSKQMDIVTLCRLLSKTADVVIMALLKEYAPNVAVITLGKLGGREITFASDLDLLFLTESEPDFQTIKDVERLLKTSLAYTKDGRIYDIDTRLRPEGSKGPIVTSLEGLHKYYLSDAHTWEIQALLKARIVVSSNQHCSLVSKFQKLREDVFLKRGHELTIKSIHKMRQRIEKELIKDTKGTDIKLCRGGLEDLEFLIQYLQIKHCQSFRGLLVQNTVSALKRLLYYGVIDEGLCKKLLNSYIFYRTLQTMLRLQEDSLLRPGTTSAQSCLWALALSSEEELFRRLEQVSGVVSEAVLQRLEAEEN